jgi:hypothetical protein
MEGRSAVLMLCCSMDDYSTLCVIVSIVPSFQAVVPHSCPIVSETDERTLRHVQQTALYYISSKQSVSSAAFKLTHETSGLFSYVVVYQGPHVFLYRSAFCIHV